MSAVGVVARGVWGLTAELAVVVGIYDNPVCVCVLGPVLLSWLGKGDNPVAVQHTAGAADPGW